MPTQEQTLNFTSTARQSLTERWNIELDVVENLFYGYGYGHEDNFYDTSSLYPASLNYFNVIGINGSFSGYGVESTPDINNSPANVTDFESSYVYGWGYEHSGSVFADDEDSIRLRATVTKDGLPVSGQRVEFNGQPGIKFLNLEEEDYSDEIFNKVFFIESSTNLASIDPDNVIVNSIVSAINTIPLNRDIEKEIVNLTDTRPVDFVIALDLSGSMGTVVPDTGGKTRRELMIEGVHGLLDLISSSNLDVRVAIVEFDNGACVTQSLTTNFAAAKSQVSSLSSCAQTAPPSPFTNTFTNIEYAIHVSHSHLDSNARLESNNFILLFSDGGENPLADALSEAESQDYQINTIIFGDDSAGITLMSNIANVTGGSFSNTLDGDGLIEIFEGQNIKFQTILQETTSNRSLWKSAISSISRNDNQEINLQSAMILGLEILSESRESDKRILIFTTIDETEGDSLTYSENFEIPVDIIYYGNDSGIIEKFTQISENTGGFFLYTDTLEEVSNLFERMFSYPLFSSVSSNFTNINGVVEILVKIDKNAVINQIDGWGSFASSDSLTSTETRVLEGFGALEVSASIYSNPTIGDGTVTLATSALQLFEEEVSQTLSFQSYAYQVF